MPALSCTSSNQWSPVIFTPSGVDQGAVDFISRKLEQAWPGRSTFLISFEKPPEKEPSVLFRVLSKFGVGRNVAYTVLAFFLVSGYELFEDRYVRGKVSWKPVLVIWGAVLLIAWATEILSRKSSRDDARKQGNVSSEAIKKLR